MKLDENTIHNRIPPLEGLVQSHELKVRSNHPVIDRTKIIDQDLIIEPELGSPFGGG